MNYLIFGHPGSGKTWLAQRTAFLICTKNVSFDEIDEHIDGIIESELYNFLQSEKYFHIQVTRSSNFEEMITDQFRHSNNHDSDTTAKPLVHFLETASLHEQQIAIIIDDLDTVDPVSYLGPLLPFLLHREGPLLQTSGAQVTIPPNVVLIFTSGGRSDGNRLPVSFLRSLSGFRTVLQATQQLQRYYADASVEKALNLVLKLMNYTNEFISRSISVDSPYLIQRYKLGYSHFIVKKNGDIRSIINDVYSRFKYIVAPLLLNYWRDNLITEDPTSFINSMQKQIHGEIRDTEEIASIEKIYLRSGDHAPDHSTADSYSYLSDSLDGNNDVSARDVMECIIDALLTNDILPLDLVFAELLENLDVGWVENEKSPGQRASYLIPENLAQDFVYLTPKNGTKTPHRFYSSAKSTGRNKENGSIGYVVNYTSNKPPVTYIPLNGFRIKSIRIDDSKLYDDGNAAVAFRSCFRLIDSYLTLVHDSYQELSAYDSSFETPAAYVRLERIYHRNLHDHIRREYSSERPRFRAYVLALLGLKTLWEQAGHHFSVDVDKLTELVVSQNCDYTEFNSLHSQSESQYQITLKKVEIMTNSEDYQLVMDRLGVRQLIFQGPPGTSKTFESKRFVLSQLAPDSECLKLPSPSKGAIDEALMPLKLAASDYDRSPSSTAGKRGGWDIVQFHPAYSYEDFIRGIRVSAQDGVPIYETINKIFGSIAALAKDAASGSPDSSAPKFYLIIDEINRADLASVFGELIYGLEYRGSKTTTPYSVKEKISGFESYELEVSENLYLIGTMNTADRSIGALDYAIRRRFLFVDSPADRRIVISSVNSSSDVNIDQSIETLLFDSVQRLFDSSEIFNDDYHRNDLRIGHTFFLRANRVNYLEQIADRTAYQIVPILREYIRDGILRPVTTPNEADYYTRLPKDDTEQIVMEVAVQLLNFANTLGESDGDDLVNEQKIRNWITGLSHHMGL